MRARSPASLRKLCVRACFGLAGGLRRGPLPRARQERASIVRDLRARQSFHGAPPSATGAPGVARPTEGESACAQRSRETQLATSRRQPLVPAIAITSPPDETT